MQGGRETDDLEVRLRWPEDAGEEGSAGQAHPRAGSTPLTDQSGADPHPIRSSAPLRPGAEGPVPPAQPEAAPLDRGDPTALELALSEMRAELLDGLADLRSELTGDVSGPVRDLAAKVAANATEVQRLVEGVLDLQQSEVDRLRREIDALRREVRQSQKAPPPWFAEAVSASLRQELEGVASQVQMLRRRLALKAREEARIDALTAEIIVEAVTTRLQEERPPSDRTTAARRSRRT